MIEIIIVRTIILVQGVINMKVVQDKFKTIKLMFSKSPNETLMYYEVGCLRQYYMSLHEYDHNLISDEVHQLYAGEIVIVNQGFNTDKIKRIIKKINSGDFVREIEFTFFDDEHVESVTMPNVEIHYTEKVKSNQELDLDISIMRNGNEKLLEQGLMNDDFDHEFYLETLTCKRLCLE